MEFKPRLHQAKFLEVCRDILPTFGQKQHTVVCSVTPGGGKSLLAPIAVKELCEKTGAKLLWVVPRSSLRSQAERNFLSPFVKEGIGVSGRFRACNNADGCVLKSNAEVGGATTYQAIVADPGLYARAFQKGKWILLLDESHHVAAASDLVDPAWEAALSPLVEKAAVVIHASGTLSRGDKKPVAFLPYVDEGDGMSVNLTPSETLHIIEYSRRDALAEGAVVTLYFEALDGHAAWVDTDGAEYRVKTLADTTGKVAKNALTSVLKSSFAHQLLDRCIDHWRQHREVYPQAKLLAVAPDIKRAKNYLAHIEGMGYRTAIATSEDSTAAHKEIDRLKAGKLDILMTVGMAYEGLDVPEVTHIACLTRIRTAPWIEQCVCRANRTAPGKHYGVIFCPDDPMMQGVVDRIRGDQMDLAYESDEQEKKPRDPDKAPNPRPQIRVLESGVTGANGFHLSGKESKTLTEVEKDLRSKVEESARDLARLTNTKPVAINSHLKKRFGKTRSKMSEGELEHVLGYIEKWKAAI